MNIEIAKPSWNINVTDSAQIPSTSLENLRSGASYDSFADFQKVSKDYESEHLCCFVQKAS